MTVKAQTPSEAKIPGLYIHIPFCVKKCGYCHFYSIEGLSEIPCYLTALFKEMEMVREKFGPMDTVYVGGGTPSVLGSADIEKIISKVQENFVLLSDTEITLEANPADLNLDFLKSLRSLGVNRLNIGIQSFDQTILYFLGRRHSVKDAVIAIENSRKAGFENIGIDLIYGITGQTLSSWKDTLDQAISFSPEHLSCYELTLENDTPLWRKYERGEYHPLEEDLQYEFFMKTSQWIEEAGYIHYEVSNFARSMAAASRHNQKYWDHTPYLGLGPSAHSLLENRRWWNHRSLGQYVCDLANGRPPISGGESLTDEQLELETIYLGLRTRKGVSLQRFEERFHYDLLEEKKTILTELLKEGLLALQNGCIIPTRQGLAVADRLALI